MSIRASFGNFHGPSVKLEPNGTRGIIELERRRNSSENMDCSKGFAKLECILVLPGVAKGVPLDLESSVMTLM